MSDFFDLLFGSFDFSGFIDGTRIENLVEKGNSNIQSAVNENPR